MSKKLRFTGFTLIFMLSMMLAACGGSDDGSSSAVGNDNNGKVAEESGGIELGDKDLELPYVNWAGAVARSHLVGKVLEDVGYNVNLKQVEAGPMWASVADNANAFTVCAWLPAIHQTYWKEYKDDVIDLKETPFSPKSPHALTVPAYMEDVNSIKDLKGNADLGEKVDWTITGIDPGAGVMINTEKAIEHYGLEKWELQSSSEAAMLTKLKKKMENKEPIVVTLWKPHWIWAYHDLKMLKEPDELLGGDGDRIDAVVNKDFPDQSPAAYHILKQMPKNYSLDIEEELMGPIFEEDEDAAEVAEQYIENHPDLVEKWVEGVAIE